MKKIIFGLMLCLAASVFSVQNQDLKSYYSRTVYGYPFSEETLLDEDLILTFVSHPEAIAHYLEGKAVENQFIAILKQEFEQLLEKFPSDPYISFVYGGICEEAKTWPFDELVGPFLTFGLYNASVLEDPIELERVQSMQVAIFKNWLARYRIGEENEGLREMLIAHCKESSLEFLTKLIGPLLEKVPSYDLIVGSYIGDDRGDYDNDEGEPEIELPPEIRKAISESIDQTLEGLDFESFLPPSISSLSAEEAIDALDAKFRPISDAHYEKYFSRDAIIFLFLRLTGQLELAH